MVVSAATIAGVYLSGTYDSLAEAALHGLFQAVSIGTTAGFTTGEYYSWPAYIAILLLFASFVGGCAGSTGGGIKVIRFLLLIKQGVREINRLIHPNGVFRIKLGDQKVPDRAVEAVWGFFSMYVIVFLCSVAFMMLISEVDFLTAFSAS